MRASIFVEGRSSGPIAYVDLEVVPRGIYEIDGVRYELKGQPTFIIRDNTLVRVELEVVLQET